MRSMSHEKDAVDGLTATLQHHPYVYFIFMAMVGAIARALVDEEPFDWRKFAGEMLLAFISGVLLWSLGLLQGLSFEQMIFLGALGALGGVKFVQWLVTIAKAVRSSP